MTDDALRASERALVTEPADLDLRRRHARLLQRAGQSDRALSALDLAWRLGADELWDELRAALDTRAVRAGGLELRYVPAGPFVMGSDDHDDDAKPAHLVELSAFFLSSRPISWSALRGTTSWDDRMEQGLSEQELEEDYPASFDEAASMARRYEVRSIQVAIPGGQGRLPTEAQWERSQRARLLHPDGQNVYGFEVNDRPEWVSDRYSPSAYHAGRRRDPAGPSRGKTRVVRGAGLPAPAYELYRDAATPDGVFEGAVRDARQRAGRDDLASPSTDVSFRLCVVPGARP